MIKLKKDNGWNGMHHISQDCMRHNSRQKRVFVLDARDDISWHGEAVMAWQHLSLHHITIRPPFTLIVAIRLLKDLCVVYIQKGSS